MFMGTQQVHDHEQVGNDEIMTDVNVGLISETGILGYSGFGTRDTVSCSAVPYSFIRD
jgi:hypothetical protein